MIFEDLLRIVRRAGMGCAACVCLFGVSEFSARAQKKEYIPDIQGVLRGKIEYQPEMGSGRFEVRNARLSLSGKIPLRSEYKLEVDLCDEYSIKMKDAWVRIRPVGNLRLTIGQQRMPFTIDAHRNPSAQFFANRSFIAKQVGNVRDVGFQIGYDFTGKDGRTILSVDAGIFNGELLENQKSAWFKTPTYSARIQFHPVKWLSLVPSIQHQMIADRQASYPSIDFGALARLGDLHLEAEFLHKSYDSQAFTDCNALNTMAIWRQRVGKEGSFLESISYLCRYDWMQDHSSGKSGFIQDADGKPTGQLALTDTERHRMTVGLTFSIRNPLFPTHIRLNYEKYWYPRGGAKVSEQDKLVCELMVRF